MGQDGVVVDANIIKIFIIEEMKDCGDICELINNLLGSYGLAVNKMVEHEWQSIIGSQFFNEWFTMNILSERIKYVNDSVKVTFAQKKKINITYGLPKNSRDIKYINCAINTKIRYILTEDIDFFDPKKKQASAEEKRRIKNQRQGKFCKFLNSEFGITAGLPEHCCTDLRNIGKII